MLKFVSNIGLIMLVGFLISCATNKPYRPLTSDETSYFTILGSVQTNFNTTSGVANNSMYGSPAPNEATKQQAYVLLKEEASKIYSGNFDIRNITVLYVSGIAFNIKWTASGDVVIPNSAGKIEGSLAKAAEVIMSSIQPSSRIAIVYVASNNIDITEFIANELEFIMVNEGFTVIDRSQLDRIRQEQNFQLSGEIDDETAVSIGKIVGANIIITGSVTGTDSTRRLRLRALNTQTAQVMAVASERL
jgi:curli biogenesis system outer membrane secretion channel CsgG